MAKEIYLVKAEGYCYIYPNGKKSVHKETINYHCCTSLEEAKENVRRWQKEEEEDNKTRKKEGKMQKLHNYQVEILDLWEE